MKDDSVDVLVVGAGAYGLSCAWWMARRRTGARILVVDEGEFASGASGRNGAGFRMQWGMECNIRLCQESIAFFETAADELDYPHGIELNPPLGRNRLVGGSFCGKDGSISPFRWLDALLEACRKLGVDVDYGTRVQRLERSNGRFRAHAGERIIDARQLLLCTDWAVPELLRPLGVDIPVTSLPKEGLVTAPAKPLVGPILISLEHRISVNQLARGSIVFIVSRHREGTDIASTPDFLGFAAPKIMDLLPGLADIPVLRTWGGVSSITPDMQPILGETDIDGIYVAVSSYRGLMTSPAVGRIMAALVLDGDTNDPILNQLGPYRFKAGKMLSEPLLNQE